MFIYLNFCFCALLSQTKTGIALLYDEVSENAYDIRLKLTKEVLTIQKQDVVCVSGSDHSANVSASISLCFRLHFNVFYRDQIMVLKCKTFYWVIEICNDALGFVHTCIPVCTNFFFFFSTSGICPLFWQI